MAASNRPGNANLPIGAVGSATVEPGNATSSSSRGSRGMNLPIGASPRSATNSHAAIQENGAPGPAWHSRGYLPHFESAALIQHVTFHLADSLPKSLLSRLAEELKFAPVGEQDAERRKRLDAWIDEGHGSCVLRVPAVGSAVEQTLLFFDGERYLLFAWVVMPNHVHALFQPLNGWTVAKVVASWKKFTARKIHDYLRSSAADAPGNADLPIGGAAPGSANLPVDDAVPGSPNLLIGGSSSPAWNREYWDRYIRNEKHFRQALEYIHSNPVKAGLVARPEDWQWSSAFRAIGGVDPGNANLPIGGFNRKP